LVANAGTFQSTSRASKRFEDWFLTLVSFDPFCDNSSTGQASKRFKDWLLMLAPFDPLAGPQKDSRIGS